MRTRVAGALVLAAAVLLAPGDAVAGRAKGTALALPLMQGDQQPTLILAQRSITRDWGTSDESTYVEVSVPDWKSEGWALALSGVVPGAGQYYLQEQHSALLFALIEVGGWIARIHFDNLDEDLRKQAASFRGNPEDSSAVWSFTRWQRNTGGDPAAIRALYENDPDDFDVRIAHDPAYAAGWAQSSSPPQDQFRNYLDRADGMLDRKKYASTALWFNHLASAVDAMRVARIHNIPLQENLRIRLKTAWRSGAPAVRASLERSF
jgi:hypothetical protein